MATFRSDSSSATTMTVTLTETGRSGNNVTMLVNWSVTTGSQTSLGASSDRTLYIYRSTGTLLGSAVIKDNVDWLKSKTYSGNFSITFSVGTTQSGTWNIYIQTSDNGTQSCIWTNRSYCTDFGMSWSTYYTSVTAATSVSASPSLAESVITVSWSGASAGTNNPIKEFQVHMSYSDNGTTWSAYSLVATGIGGSYPHYITSENRGRQFKFKIHTVPTNYGSNAVSAETNVVTRNRIPSVPVSPSVSVSSVAAGTAISVSFTPSTDADNNLAGYEVALKNSSGTWYNSGEIIGTGGAAATYIDIDTTGWASGNSWSFFVRAYDSLGVRSNYSSTGTALVTIGGAPSIPLNIKYNGGTGAYTESPVTLSWDTPASTFGLSYTYELRLGVWNGTGYDYSSTIDKGTSTSHSWTISGYTRGQRLYAQVRAVNSVGSSAWAGNSIDLFYNQIPATPTLIFPKSGSTIYNTSPRIGYLYGTDADGQSVLGSVTLDGITKDANDSAWSRTGRQTTAVQSLVRGWTLTPDNYTVTARGNDGLVNSSQTQRTFTVASPSWTDSTITPKVTPMKAAHINEIRTALENVYNYYNLSAPTWTDTIEVGGQIKAIHVSELRTAIEAIRTYVNGFDTGTSKNIAAFSWTDSSLANKRIKAVHMTELRNAITLL